MPKIRSEENEMSAKNAHCLTVAFFTWKIEIAALYILHQKTSYQPPNSPATEKTIDNEKS
jgi:hypothetical protein